MREGWIRRLVTLGVCLVAGWVIVRLIGRVDWAAVGDALGRLAWWQLLVLLLLLLLRQLVNALPLALYIPGLGVRRAVINDVAAHLLAVAVPPPGDMVMRVGIFTSWGIEASRAVAGSIMNTLTFYITRFSVPVLGFLVILPVRFDRGYAVTALLGVLVAAAIAGLVVLGLRSEELAARIGRSGGALASKVRKSVDPEAWADWVVAFRAQVQHIFAAGFARSATALVLLVLTDATILLFALRFVGVGAAEVPTVEVYAAFLCAYPLTVFPFMGLGIADAVLLATFVAAGGLEVEAAAVAALVVWRSVTLLGSITLGAGALAYWRYDTRRHVGADPGTG